ncbi:TPA: PIG-L deacetylase family protein [Morganella morganii]|nr:PIG-L family deacetylase [Morganella morganii subsp. morganii]
MKIWFIGAHFDDIEIGCGGTAAKLISQGHECHVTIVTNSGYSDEYGNIVRESSVARDEGLAGLKTLGFKYINELNLETGKLTHGHQLIHELEKLSKEIKPDIVFTHWDQDVHQDHAAVAKSSFTVCRKAGSILMYRPNWYRTSVQFHESIFVDVSDFYQIKKNAINMHVSEVTKFGKHWESFIEAQDKARGMEINAEFAESFQVVKLQLFKGE